MDLHSVFLVLLDGFTLGVLSDFGLIYTVFLVFLDGFTLGVFSDFGWIYIGCFSVFWMDLHWVFLDGFTLCFSAFGWIYTYHYATGSRAPGGTLKYISISFYKYEILVHQKGFLELWSPDMKFISY